MAKGEVMHNLSIRGLGWPGGRQWRRHNDLDALAGTWTAADAAEFERATADFDEIDTALWRPEA
jgi:hypothetical protein